MNCRFCKDFLQLLAACTLCNKFQPACFQQCRHFSCHCRFRFRFKSLGRARPPPSPCLASFLQEDAMQSIKAGNNQFLLPCLAMLQINTQTHTHTRRACNLSCLSVYKIFVHRFNPDKCDQVARQQQRQQKQEHFPQLRKHFPQLELSLMKCRGRWGLALGTLRGVRPCTTVEMV